MARSKKVWPGGRQTAGRAEDATNAKPSLDRCLLVLLLNVGLMMIVDGC